MFICKWPNATERQGVEIDHCPKCRRVWLDRGELNKIIERSGSQETQRPAASPAVAPQWGALQYGSHHRGGYGKHGKGGWLRDLFD